jgi:hypothetical protein
MIRIRGQLSDGEQGCCREVVPRFLPLYSISTCLLLYLTRDGPDVNIRLDTRGRHITIPPDSFCPPNTSKQPCRFVNPRFERRAGVADAGTSDDMRRVHVYVAGFNSHRSFCKVPAYIKFGDRLITSNSHRNKTTHRCCHDRQRRKPFLRHPRTRAPPAESVVCRWI